MKKIIIGMLLPTSGIRSMAKDYNNAFNGALHNVLAGTEYEFEVISEMIGQGNISNIEQALDKFFGYHNVDIVTGIASVIAMDKFFEKFDKRKKALILSNLGEHFFSIKNANEYIFYNSAHLLQQCWLLGNYAIKNIGKNGLILGSMYDLGYAFNINFDAGAKAADPSVILDIKFLPMPKPGDLSEIGQVFESIDLTTYDFVFPLFCGEEATLFLEGIKERKLQGKVNLIGLPFLLESGEKSLEGLEVFTSNVDTLNDVTMEKIYTNLGQTAGEAVGKAIIHSKGNLDPSTIDKALKAVNKTKTYQSTDMPQLNQEIKIVKANYNSDNNINVSIQHSEVKDMRSDSVINQLREAVYSSWQNPYLSI